MYLSSRLMSKRAKAKSVLCTHTWHWVKAHKWQLFKCEKSHIILDLVLSKAYYSLSRWLRFMFFIILTLTSTKLYQCFFHIYRIIQTNQLWKWSETTGAYVCVITLIYNLHLANITVKIPTCDLEEQKVKFKWHLPNY